MVPDQLLSLSLQSGWELLAEDRPPPDFCLQQYASTLGTPGSCMNPTRVLQTFSHLLSGTMWLPWEREGGMKAAVVYLS